MACQSGELGGLPALYGSASASAMAVAAAAAKRVSASLPAMALVRAAQNRRRCGGVGGEVVGAVERLV